MRQPRGKLEPWVVAVVCSDIHLSHNPPAARAGEPDWYAAMDRTLEQVRNLCRVYGVPLVIAGDVFHHWRPPPELINFAITALRTDHGTYAIPGQHDLPNHRLEDIGRSAYWTLVAAGTVRNLDPEQAASLTSIDPSDPKRERHVGMRLSAYPWGHPLGPPPNGFAEGRVVGPVLDVAIVHTYCWVPGRSYPGACPEAEASSYAKKLAGFDAAIFGDNHKGFGHDYDVGGKVLHVFNCGGLMRRASDELQSRPTVGLLLSTGAVVPHHLDTVYEQMEAVVQAKPRAVADMGDFIEGLRGLGGDALNFETALWRYCDANGVDSPTRDVLTEVIDGCRTRR